MLDLPEPDERVACSLFISDRTNNHTRLTAESSLEISCWDREPRNNEKKRAWKLPNLLGDSKKNAGSAMSA